MKILDLYQDFGLDFKTEGHKHCRPGWVNVECPFCTGNPGYHLGYEIEQNYFYCWRCGYHPVIPTISKLINEPESKIPKILRQYGGIGYVIHAKETGEKLDFKLPTGTSAIALPHIHYLEKRGYDAQKLVRDWDIQGTGPLATLDKINYGNRVIVPVYWNGNIVSFIARSISKRNPYRYLTAPKNRELVFHKKILYGKQEKWKRVGICVEGVTDVWRLGEYSFATFGIEYKSAQMIQIAKAFDFVFILYDNESQANVQADKLAFDLQFLRVKTKRINVPGKDPGSMKQDDADYLVRNLMNTKIIKL